MISPLHTPLALVKRPLFDPRHPVELYLVSRDTGQWHTLATFDYNSGIFGPTVTPRVVPGTYDIYYCHGCSTPSSGGITAETDAADAFPRGLRVLDACVAVL